MLRFSHLTFVGFVSLALVGCDAPPAPSSPIVASGPPAEHLNRLVERYWDERTAADAWFTLPRLDPASAVPPQEDLSAQSIADSLARERRYLNELAAVPRAGLDAEAALTYDIFQRDREVAIEGFTFPGELLPLDPYDDIPLRFAVMASLRRAGMPADTRWQAQSDAVVHWIDEAIVNLRDGVRRGYTLPRIVVDRLLPPLRLLAATTPANVLYPGDSAASVNDRVLPAYRRLHDFLEHEYRPSARSSVGLSALPLGESWYAWLARRATGSQQSPAQWHALGVAEVTRIHDRMHALLGQVSFGGSLRDYVEHLHGDPRFVDESPETLLAAYQELNVDISAALPLAFPRMPKTDVSIRPLEAFRAATAPSVSYRPRGPGDKTGGILFVNTVARGTDAALPLAPQFLRAAVPGYHYQLDLQHERVELPRFRRWGGAPAFIAGWGQYATLLGEKLGVYRDPESKFTALLLQLNCAAAAVIDTGVHTQAWSRDQALNYWRAEVPGDDASAADRVDRVIARPAEALACMVGAVTFEELRAHAERSLAEHFDERAFHERLLEEGAIPLDLLEARMNVWIQEQRVAVPPAGTESR